MSAEVSTVEEGRFRSYLDYYLTRARTQIQSNFQYRVATYMWLVGMLAEPIVYLVVWTTIADQQGGSVQGITTGEFAAYYIVWTLVRNMNIVFTPYGWEWRIREGELSAALLRPLHPIHDDIAGFAGWKVVTIILWLPIAAVLWIAFDPSIDIRAAEIAAFCVAIWGAYLIRTMFLTSLGMVTFWTTRVSALFELAVGLELLLSGRLVPLPLMPAWAEDVANVLPFKWSFYFPIQTLVGDLSNRELLEGLGIQLLWIVALTGLVPRRLAVRDQALLGGRELMRIGRLAWLFFKVGSLNELQYRANFFIQLLQSAVSVGVALVVLALVYSQTTELNGWNESELMIVLGIQILLGGVIRTTIQPNMQRLMEDVRDGKLDFALTKPEDSQVLVSIRNVQIWRAVDVIAGAAVLAYGIDGLDASVGVGDVLLFLGLLVLGAVTIYCFWLVIATLAFWIVNVWEIIELFDGIYQAGRWPTSIFPGWLRFGVTFIFPLAFAITVPAEAITSRLEWSTVGIAIGFAVVLFAFTRWWWGFGLRRYSGASA